MRKILVCGAEGQLGRSIREIATDYPARFTFTDLPVVDITDEESVSKAFEEHTPDVVINCAAWTDVEAAEDHPQGAEILNCKAPALLARRCLADNALLIHISTDYVFDGRGNLPIDEEASTAPLSSYGRSKLAGEHEIIGSGCNHVIVRTSWLYSQYGKNFFCTMQRLAEEKNEITVVFDQTGTPTYAADLARALCNIACNPDYESMREIFHYSNEGVCSWYDFATEILKLLGKPCRVIPCRSSQFPTKAARPCYSVLDKSKFRNTFKCEIPHWRTSLEQLITLLNKI